MVARVAQWFVKDLKSLGESKIPLRRLDLITGPNSSGKSSFIQSILFATQSIARGVFLLNGPLVRFGSADDAIRDGASSMEFGVSVPVGSDEKMPAKFQWSLKSGGDELLLSNLTASLPDEKVFEATDSYLSQATRAELIDKFHGDGVLRIKTIAGSRAPARSYIIFRGMLPSWIVTPFNRDEFLQRLSRSVARRDRANDLRDYLAAYPEIFKNLGLRERPMHLRPWGILGDLESLDDVEYDETLEKIANRIAEQGWEPINVSQTSFKPLSDGRLGRLDNVLIFLIFLSESMSDFASKVKYLGPLRDEPRVISPSGSLSPATPVGVRGEYAADYLSSVKDRTISVANARGIISDMTIGGALAEWIRYLELGDEVRVLDQGKLGKGFVLKVGDSERDLTTIGVGASQILPVLLLVIAAEPGSLVLIEQPELHLHPAVQSRLADFLLVARPDLRIVVETHSEYMVTRVRLRVAQKRIATDQIALLFVEKRADSSVIKHLDFNSIGSLSEWPEGFFDSQEQDGALILDAISKAIKRDGKRS
ncbi:DUF3696 domain-containing protein [Arsenicicoccus dermatophilus]|uniref:DUF3696 domain-containing protein n=1 Tax=Arsenicicoccus dermatophilus TaxID=1076331 RepID=UPI001F4CAF51|nr:DUF3696 domain-containing protein [Arsenicicoccus dermatophilus]MCH8611894.1 DUF3696 domain-containing protein [Arsenicicoccus dermatophilus]